MKFAVLGDILFEPITGFTGDRSKIGIDFAEHPLIEGKPDLQYVGSGLEEIDLDMRFHVSFCDPQEQLDRLLEAAAEHERMTLVMGNGRVRGDFVITETQADARWYHPQGRLLWVEVAVKLKEYVSVRYVDAQPGVRAE